MLHARNENYTKHIDEAVNSVHKLPNGRTVCENKEEIQKQEKHLNLYNIKKIELHVDDSIKLSNESKEASKVCGCSSRTKGLRKRRIITKSMHEGL